MVPKLFTLDGYPRAKGLLAGPLQDGRLRRIGRNDAKNTSFQERPVSLPDLRERCLYASLQT